MTRPKEPSCHPPDLHEAVRAARERYAPATVDRLPILFFIVLSDGRLVHANAPLARLLGREPEELVGSTAQQLLALEDPDEVARRLGDAMSGGATTGEVRLALPDGRPHPVLLSVHRLDLGGQPTLVGTGVDLTPRIRAERRAHAYEALVRAAFEASPDAFAVVDDAGAIAVANQRFHAIFPSGPRSESDTFVDRVAAATVTPHEGRDDMNALIASDGASGSTRLRLRDGRTVEHSSEPFTSEDGTKARVVHVRDVSETVAAEEHLAALNAGLGRRLDEQWEELRSATDRLEHLAFHDPLTGLPNRRHLYDEVDARLAQLVAAEATPDGQAANASTPPFDLVYVDLDGFKGVNDRYGHEAGDCVLRVQAQRMQDLVASVGLAARLAGDEFVLIVDRRPPHGLPALLADLSDTLGQAIPIGSAHVQVTASFGVAHARPGVEGADALLTEADTQMYDAKRRLLRRRDDRPRD